MCQACGIAAGWSYQAKVIVPPKRVGETFMPPEYGNRSRDKFIMSLCAEALADYLSYHLEVGQQQTATEASTHAFHKITYPLYALRHLLWPHKPSERPPALHHGRP